MPQKVQQKNLPRFLRGDKVDEIFGRKRTARYQEIKLGLFPPPVTLGPKSAGYPEDEVAAVHAARVSGWTDDEVRALVRELLKKRSQQARQVMQRLGIDASGTSGAAHGRNVPRQKVEAPA